MCVWAGRGGAEKKKGASLFSTCYVPEHVYSINRETDGTTRAHKSRYAVSRSSSKQRQRQRQRTPRRRDRVVMNNSCGFRDRRQCGGGVARAVTAQSDTQCATTVARTTYIVYAKKPLLLPIPATVLSDAGFCRAKGDDHERCTTSRNATSDKLKDFPKSYRPQT